MPFKVLGADCDFKDVARYQALASNVKFNYEFVESSKTFNIIITNMPEQGITPDSGFLFIFNNKIDDFSVDDIVIIREDVR